MFKAFADKGRERHLAWVTRVFTPLLSSAPARRQRQLHQPQIAMAAGLREHGIEARVAAPENLRSFVERAGVEYAPLVGNSQEILESEPGQRWLRSGDVRAFMKEATNISKRVDPDVFRSALTAVHDADAIVGGTLAEDMSFTLAQHRKVPFIFGHTIPFETTGEYASPLVTPRALPFGFLNRATYSLFRMLATDIHTDTLAVFRRDLGLAPMVSWLGAGKPPVYIGFGSVPMPALTSFVEGVLAIGKELGLRIALEDEPRHPAAVGRTLEEGHRSRVRLFECASLSAARRAPRCALGTA